MCQYPDVSIGDKSDFNLNFSSELCKRVRHLSPHLTLLCGFGSPRISRVKDKSIRNNVCVATALRVHGSGVLTGRNLILDEALRHTK